MAGWRDEDARLEAHSAETVLRYAHLDSARQEAMQEAYVALLRRVDELAADGHRDEESWMVVKYCTAWSGTLRQRCACACFVHVYR